MNFIPAQDKIHILDVFMYYVRIKLVGAVT